MVVVGKTAQGMLMVAGLFPAFAGAAFLAGGIAAAYVGVHSYSAIKANLETRTKTVRSLQTSKALSNP